MKTVVVIGEDVPYGAVGPTSEAPSTWHDARVHNPPIKAFYELVCGKPGKVALVAAMRKLLTMQATGPPTQLGDQIFDTAEYLLPSHSHSPVGAGLVPALPPLTPTLSKAEWIPIASPLAKKHRTLPSNVRCLQAILSVESLPPTTESRTSPSSPSCFLSPPEPPL